MPFKDDRENGRKSGWRKKKRAFYRWGDTKTIVWYKHQDGADSGDENPDLIDETMNEYRMLPGQEYSLKKHGGWKITDRIVEANKEAGACNAIITMDKLKWDAGQVTIKGSDGETREWDNVALKSFVKAFVKDSKEEKKVERGEENKAKSKRNRGQKVEFHKNHKKPIHAETDSSKKLSCYYSRILDDFYEPNTYQQIPKGKYLSKACSTIVMDEPHYWCLRNEKSKCTCSHCSNGGKIRIHEKVQVGAEKDVSLEETTETWEEETGQPGEVFSCPISKIPVEIDVQAAMVPDKRNKKIKPFKKAISTLDLSQIIISQQDTLEDSEDELDFETMSDTELLNDWVLIES